MTQRPWLPLAAAGTTLLLWASAFVAIRHLGGTFTPGSLSLGRLVFGSVALGIGVAVHGWVRPTRRDWLPMILIGLLWFGIYNVALNAGELRVDAGTAAMLIQTAPVLVAILAVLFLGEQMTGYLVVGMMLAFGGVAVIALPGTSGGADLVGSLLCVLSAVVYSISLILQKPVVARVPAVQLTWIACTAGAVFCLPFAPSLAAEAAAASWGDIGWLAYLGIFPTAIAFTTYAFALGHMDASRLAVSTYLVPPITVLISWVLLGETPPASVWLGGAMCLVGVAITRRTSRRQRAARSSAARDALLGGPGGAADPVSGPGPTGR